MPEKLLTELSPQAAITLKTLLDAPSIPHWAGGIAMLTGMAPSNICRHLMLLEKAGLVESWEQNDRTVSGRPRRYYKFTKGAVAAARRELKLWGRA